MKKQLVTWWLTDKCFYEKSGLVQPDLETFTYNRGSFYDSIKRVIRNAKYPLALKVGHCFNTLKVSIRVRVALLKRYYFLFP